MSSHHMLPRHKGNSNTDQASPTLELEEEDSTAKRPTEHMSSYDTGRRRKSTTTREEEEIKRQKRMAAGRRSAAASRQRRLDLIENLKTTVVDLNQTVTDLRTENMELRCQFRRQKAAMGASVPLVQIGGRVFGDHRMAVASIGTVPSIVDKIPAHFHLTSVPSSTVVSASATLLQEQPHPYPLLSSLGVRQDALNHLSRHPDSVMLHRQPVNERRLTPYEELQRQATRQQQELDSIIQALQAGEPIP